MKATKINWKKVYFLPINFKCPRCRKVVKTDDDGALVYCDCIRVPYKGKLPGIIPGPNEILPKLQEGEAVDYHDITEETSFRWGRFVAQHRGEP